MTVNLLSYRLGRAGYHNCGTGKIEDEIKHLYEDEIEHLCEHSDGLVKWLQKMNFCMENVDVTMRN